MDETILLNNGMLIENVQCLESSGQLFLFLVGRTEFQTWLDLFDNPDNTEIIVATRYGEDTTYTGYTNLFSMSKEYGNINLVLRKS